MYLLKNALAMQYITCLLPTQHLKRCSSGTPTAIISSHISQLLWSKAQFPLGNKWRYLEIIFHQYLTIIIKTSAIRFTYIRSEFWSSFDIMSGSEGKNILFLQLVVLFKMKMKKRRKRKKLSTRIIS